MRLRLAAAAGPLARTAIVRMDPEIEAGHRLPPDVGDAGTSATVAIEDLLEETGWHPAHDMQPRRTRIVDLSADEDALWSDLRKKWRQYVNKARTGGVVVRDVDPRAEPDAFDTFYAVMREVSKRTALPLRSAATFRAVWEAYAPQGESRLLFAEAAGEVQAVLLTVRCGTRVVEPYGGMTSAGADSRANYLLKWEAIRSSREQGATTYDLWGRKVAKGLLHHDRDGAVVDRLRHVVMAVDAQPADGHEQVARLDGAGVVADRADDQVLGTDVARRCLGDRHKRDQPVLLPPALEQLGERASCARTFRHPRPAPSAARGARP
jgi:hypothetical protein